MLPTPMHVRPACSTARTMARRGANQHERLFLALCFITGLALGIWAAQS